MASKLDLLRSQETPTELRHEFGPCGVLMAKTRLGTARSDRMNMKWAAQHRRQGQAHSQHLATAFQEGAVHIGQRRVVGHIPQAR